jgi:hypothetical protein
MNNDLQTDIIVSVTDLLKCQRADLYFTCKNTPVCVPVQLRIRTANGALESTRRVDLGNGFPIVNRSGHGIF